MAKEVSEDRPQIGISQNISPEPLVVGTGADAKSVSLVVLAVLATALVLHVARDVFIPIFLSILISYALDPIVTALARRHLHRALGAGLVLLFLMGGLGVGVYGLRDQASQVLDSLPDAAHRLRQAVQSRGGAP